MISGLSAATAARAGRVDRPVVGLLTTVALPAGLVGAIGTSLLPREWFALFFGTLLLVIGLYLAWRPAATYADPVSRGWDRQLKDGDGDLYHYRMPVRAGLLATGSTAFLSALAGISGGLIYTPLATRVMRIPPHTGRADRTDGEHRHGDHGRELPPARRLRRVRADGGRTGAGRRSAGLHPARESDQSTAWRRAALAVARGWPGRRRCTHRLPRVLRYTRRKQPRWRYSPLRSRLTDSPRDWSLR
jgi:hypothetical protein